MRRLIAATYSLDRLSRVVPQIMADLHDAGVIIYRYPAPAVLHTSPEYKGIKTLKQGQDLGCMGSKPALNSKGLRLDTQEFWLRSDCAPSQP